LTPVGVLEAAVGESGLTYATFEVVENEEYRAPVVFVEVFA
jgi:hypothetical protein